MSEESQVPPPMKKTTSSYESAIPGLALMGCFVTGVIGLLVGLFGGEGMALFASAVAFGTLVVVSYQK